MEYRYKYNMLAEDVKPGEIDKKFNNWLRSQWQWFYDHYDQLSGKEKFEITEQLGNLLEVHNQLRGCNQILANQPEFFTCGISLETAEASHD